MRPFLPSVFLSMSSLLLPVLAAQTSSAVAAPKDSGSAKDIYAGESFIIERSDWLYAENADGTGFREHTVSVRMQSEPSLREFGVISIPFASASEHVELRYVRVRHADGSTTETPASDAIEQPEQVTRDAPFYSDLKDEQLPVKNLKVGDTLEWQARVIRARAEATNQFWGQEVLYAEDSVILNQSIELRYPATSKVIVWTNPRSGIKPAETTDGASKVYRWSLTQLKPTTGPEAEAAKKAKKKQVLTEEEQQDYELGKLPTIAWTTFPSWDAVGAWYRSLESERAHPDDEIKAKVKDLTANSKTEEEKVRAIYAYVSAQIRYIGVAFGVGRYQPHEAADVLHNQYGDCKDKATLLSSMLEAIGLHPDSVLIGAGVRFNEAVPSPSAFNHLITRVKLGSDEVWLDATQEVAPYRALLPLLRDKPALVVPDKGAASIEHAPPNLPFTSFATWTAKGSIDKDGTTDSHIMLTTRGDTEITLRSLVHQVPAANYDTLAQKFAEGLGYGGTTSHAEFSRPEDTAEPFVISFDYRREKPNEWDNLKVVPQFLPISLPSVDEKDPPVAAIQLGTPTSVTSTAELKIPEGWTVELPEAVHEKSEWVTDDVTYSFDRGTLHSQRTLVILKDKVPATNWKDYKKFTDAISLGFESYVQLVRSGGSARPQASAHAHQANAQAVDLLNKAFTAMDSGDIKTAESLLKQARNIDPETRRLWAGYAWLASKRNKPAEAAEDYRKELTLYPHSYDIYPYLARAQWEHRDKDGALATAREWVANDPQSPKAQRYLAGILFDMQKFSESADAAAKTLTLTPETDKRAIDNCTMLLGRAQIKAGQNDKGSATLKSLLESTENPGYLNDAAYELADANLLLPFDEEKVRKALDKLDTETEAWTLDEAPAQLAARSNLLVASWDTLGWILYREGKTAEAKTWIQASYLNNFHPEVKKHLEEINAHLGTATQAKNRKSEIPSRTYPLGAYGGGKAYAEYRVLLQHGKLIRAKATGTPLPFAEDLLKEVSFAHLFPESSDARLVRTGVVNCNSGKCDFVIEP